MKILLNLLAAKQGGQLTRSLEFIRNCYLYKDNEFTLYVLSNNHKIKKYDTPSSNINIISSGKFINTSNWIIRILWENFYQPILFNSLKPDIYLTFSHSLPFFFKNITSIIAVSNLAPFSNSYFKMESLYGKFRLKALKFQIIYSSKKASQVIALSHECKKILILNGISSNKIHVITNGLNKDKFKNKDLYINNNNKNYFLYVSHFYRYKNFEQLIYAYNNLSNDIKSNYKLKLVGNYTDKKYTEEIMELVSKLKLSDRVEFLPNIKDNKLNQIYCNAKLFIFSSLIENCPNILLETMAFSLPILVIDVKPMQEFTGESVIYFKKNDYMDLSNKIDMLIKSPKLIQQLKLKSYQQSQKFSWTHFTNSVIKLCYLEYYKRI